MISWGIEGNVVAGEWTKEAVESHRRGGQGPPAGGQLSSHGENGTGD